jgi:peptide methionine sulfoxide reductase MsrB
MIAADEISKTDAEWRARLTPEQFNVTRRHGTERAGTSPLNAEKRAGSYASVCCSGPPSFDQPANGAALKFKPDDT